LTMISYSITKYRNEDRNFFFCVLKTVLFIFYPLL
jgi:hypothetical protein